MFDTTFVVWQLIAQIVAFGVTLGLGWFIALFLWRPLNGLGARLEKNQLGRFVVGLHP